jgi:hypothetical protein
MPRIPTLGRRPGALGLALTAYDLWRRLPEKQRRQLLENGRRHGSRLAVEAAKRGTTQLKKRPK